MVVNRLRLQTSFLEELSLFYIDILGLKVVSREATSFAVQCGASILEFENGENAYYHFAFNIPSDMLDAGVVWLESLGIPLLPFEGEVVVPFPSWDAAGIYFHDPGGNILEFIARRRLEIPSQPQFGVECIVCISEIGFGTYSFASIKDSFTRELNLAEFWNNGNQFSALGDAQGLVILVDANLKKWIPTMVEALPFPFVAEITEVGVSHKVEWDNRMLTFSKMMH